MKLFNDDNTVRMCCATCRHAQLAFDETEVMFAEMMAKDHGDSLLGAECRAKPPRLRFDDETEKSFAVWPTCALGDWCSHWQPSDEADREAAKLKLGVAD